jgi:hypothetical protein
LPDPLALLFPHRRWRPRHPCPATCSTAAQSTTDTAQSLRPRPTNPTGKIGSRLCPASAWSPTEPVDWRPKGPTECSHPVAEAQSPTLLSPKPSPRHSLPIVACRGSWPGFLPQITFLFRSLPFPFPSLTTISTLSLTKLPSPSRLDASPFIYKPNRLLSLSLAHTHSRLPLRPPPSKQRPQK